MPRLVTIGWFTEPWDAYIARGRLQSEDVLAWVVHEHHVWANWMYSNVLGQVKLQVLERDAQRGTALLERHWKGEFESALEEEFGPLPKHTCPSCGSAAISKRVGLAQTMLVFGVYATLGLACPPRKKVAHCETCRYEWRRW